MKKILLFNIIVLNLVSACMHAGTRTIPLFIGKNKITVEIADTYDKQATGLMYRKKLAPNAGMLFTYNQEEYHSFWMKNCFINLDIIYLNRNKQIVDMFLNVPPCQKEPCENYTTKIPAQYVLELRGNRAKELKLAIGDSVFFIVD